MPYCEPCNRFFNTDNAFRVHRINSNRHNFCPWCNQEFYYSQDYREHNDRYHYRCGGCHAVFRREADLEAHLGNCFYYCSPCRKYFNNENQLNQHLNSNIHKPKSHICPGRGCSRGFISWSALIKHIEMGTCPSGLNREQLNKLVVRMDQNNVITNPARLITGPGGRIEPATTTTKTWATQRSYNGRYFECFLCHSEFRLLAALNQHLQSGVHDGKIYRCPNRQSCGQEFSVLSALTGHVESGKCGVQQFKQVRAVMESLNRNINRITC